MPLGLAQRAVAGGGCGAAPALAAVDAGAGAAGAMLDAARHGTAPQGAHAHAPAEAPVMGDLAGACAGPVVAAARVLLAETRVPSAAPAGGRTLPPLPARTPPPAPPPRLS